MARDSKSDATGKVLSNCDSLMRRGDAAKILWWNLIMWNLFSHTVDGDDIKVIFDGTTHIFFNAVDTHFFPKESRACANEVKITSGFESEMKKKSDETMGGNF